MSTTAGLFIASFIWDKNMGLSIISSIASGFGGGPIYVMLASSRMRSECGRTPPSAPNMSIEGSPWKPA
jgi:hypothetical protein